MDCSGFSWTTSNCPSLQTICNGVFHFSLIRCCTTKRMNEIILFNAIFGLAYHVIFLSILPSAPSSEWHKRRFVSWFWTLRTKAKRTNAEGLLKVPKTMLQENSPFLYDYVSLLLLENVKEKKTFENVSRVCKNRKNEYKKFQRIPSRRNGCQFPVMTFSFFTTNQFPKLRLHSRPRMQNCTCNSG